MLKASQSIASQVKYNDLLKMLMHVIIENAGAEKGCFLLNKEDHLYIEAIAISGEKGIKVLYENLEEKVVERTPKIEKTLEELKFTQTQLIQSEKISSLGEHTAGIAHEIQNLLNFVNNFSEVSGELVDEMYDELDKDEIAEAKSIAVATVFHQESKIISSNLSSPPSPPEKVRAWD